MKKLITVGIPAYKAEDHIDDLLSSIQIQSIRNEVSVIIAKDNPDDNYEFVKDKFKKLDITILECEKNTGPGLARQRALDACKTEWITFADADDILINPVALERLRDGIISREVIEVQGPFFQEFKEDNMPTMMSPRNDAGHPWVFGRLYNVRFLRENEIKFNELRAMEDGYFNWCIRMTIEGTPLAINVIQDPVYYWRTGSEHSITRIGIDENNIPQYNFDLCQWGGTIASIQAAKFCRKRNPFNGSITRFIVEQMISQYFTYIECLARKPIFAKQNLYNAKKFYHECYKEIEFQIDNDIIKNMYTEQMAGRAQELIGIIPEITFFDFMEKIKTEEYGGDEEFKKIRKELPKEIIENDLKTGVLGEETDCKYTYTLNVPSYTGTSTINYQNSFGKFTSTKSVD